ncbi:MAG: hypothetical protein K6A38_00160 [Lachnospiraceae bacterium]|nr:hypothetical protein [Lachnospiraceae bacterium]
MKKRLMAFLLGAALTLELILPSFAEDEITVEVESIKEQTDVNTGTRQDAMDSQNDVDEDIADEISSEVLPGWEIIKIGSAEDLTEFSKNCRLDIWSRNKHVILTADINLSQSDFVQIPTFGGTFDGNGHTISEFMFDSGESYAGLFAYLQEDAIVKGLTLKGRVEPSGKQVSVGGLVGENNGVVINCSFDGVIAGNDYVGGIAGINGLTGIIADSEFNGVIVGTHFTGGIAGENMGNILRCTNRGRVNTAEADVSMSIDDINLDSYISMLEPDEDGQMSDKAEMNNGVVDSGGIAGLSMGVIQHSTNEGDVGYEHLGYNVGGIAGRQSGYIYDCTNEGCIKGRKDVGGIVGQAEPYVTVDLSHDIAYQLTENIEKLHDIISVTLKDADNESDAVSNRLSIIQQFTGSALEDTRYLSDNTITYANDISSAANDAFSRVDYILEESAKTNGPLDQISSSASNAKKAAGNIEDAVRDLDIYAYLSDAQKEEYDNYRNTVKDASNEYDGYLDRAKKPYYNYYIYNNEGSYTGTGDLALIKDEDNEYTYNGTAINAPADGRQQATSYAMSSSLGANDMPVNADDFFNEFGKNGTWVHHNDLSGTDASFPNGDDDAQKAEDEGMIEDAGEYAAQKSKAYADKAYTDAHPGRTYTKDMTDAAEGMAALINEHLPEMSSDLREDAEEAVGDLENAAGNIESSFSQTKDIIRNLGDREAVQFPELSKEYREHAASLSNNLQGMNDNFGYLNAEMNEASDTLINDLGNISDQFNTIMLLYTDAIDGVLDRDYSNTIRDDSLDVAQTCTDATVDLCRNKGSVSGDINVAGIAGTMAIEYDFDLESDVTGIKDSNLNSTFLTKCVLRKNDNNGPVTAEKSYVGGICGLQEMGTILGCGSYADITSNSGSYAGGIAGSSLSYIVRCYSKCMLSSSEYVGGIAGEGTHISDSLSMVKISENERWYGAIAGHIAKDGRVRNNFFISEDLGGIDRVSYSKKAEPITYGALLQRYETDDIPEEFRTMTITFVLDDPDSEDDGKILGQTSVGYGERISINPPDLDSDREGYYLDYEEALKDRIYTDEKVKVKYKRYRTTLAGAVTDEDKQSSVLIDGQFREGDVLEAIREVDEEKPDLENGVIETWSIKIPDDGNEVHQLRYLPNETTRLEKLKKLEEIGLYIYEDGEWVELKSTGMMGRYYTYNVSGNNIMIRSKVNNIHKISRVIIVLAIIAGVLLAAGIILTSVFFNRKKKKIAKAAKKIKNAAIEAVSNMGSSNDIFYHGKEDENGNPVEEDESPQIR